MAKQTYVVSDDRGFNWVVKQGDPSFGLVSKVKHPVVVLPQRTLLTGELTEHNIPVDARVRRLTKACEQFPDDLSLADALLRAVSLRACLLELGDSTIETVSKE